MTNAVSPFGSAQPVQATAVLSAASNAVRQREENAKPSDAVSVPISPRITIDPLAGVITEFLGENGQVKAQIPSATVVAYLRAGLNPQGLPNQLSPSDAAEEKTGGFIA
ncbi:MAG: hypothetical protein AB7H77_01640 [Bdellovibrionales bacterium]